MDRIRVGALLAAAASFFCSAQAAEAGGKDFSATNLFEVTNVWTAHLTLAADQWQAMEPKGGEGGFLAMFGSSFAVGTMLAPAMMKAGDQNGDRKLSKDEFTALGEKWFADWGRTNAGKVKLEQVNAGIGAAMSGSGVGFPNLLAGEGKRNGVASLIGIEFSQVHADLEFAGAAFTNVAVRYKGNGTFVESRASLKRPLKVDLNQFVKGQKLAGISKLNFHNNVSDQSSMKEPLAFRLFRDAGVAAPRTAYARMFVTVPGMHDRKYFGLYSLVENVDANFAADRFKVKNGAIFKPTTRSPFTDLGEDWKGYQQIYDPKTELTAAQKERLIAFCKLVSHGTDAEFDARAGSYIDLEQFARFMAVTVYLSSGDGILSVGQNYYVYLHPTTGKFHFTAWDHDHSFNDFLSGVSEPGQLSIAQPWSGENQFLERMFKLEAFKELYLQRLREFHGKLFQPERLVAQTLEMAAAIREALKEESPEALARMEKAVAGEAPAASGFGFGPRNPGLNPIKVFAGLRSQSISDQIAGKSDGKIPDGFGPFGGGGQPGQGGGFGPGMLLGGLFMNSLDRDKNGTLAPEEFSAAFSGWFKTWDSEKTGFLTEDQVRTGMNKDLPLFGGGGFPGPQ